MKFKYFLRGLGTGIIFASIICIVAFQTSDSRQISDKEVIERAKDLGMVESDVSAKDMFVSTELTTENTTEKATTKEENKEEKTTEKDTTEEVAEKKTTEATTEKKTTEEKTTEATTEKKTTESTTEKATTEKTTEQSTPKTVTITIRGGMSSYPVCQMLQELGMIKDASDFDNYLIKNGYANRISVGTHTLTIGMTYEEIAIAISDPR